MQFQPYAITDAVCLIFHGAESEGYLIVFQFQVFNKSIPLEFLQNFIHDPDFSAIFHGHFSGTFDGHFMGQTTGSHCLQPAAGRLPVFQMTEQELCHLSDRFISFRLRRTMRFAHQFRALGIQKVFQCQLHGIADLFIGFHIIDASFHQIRMYHLHPCLTARLITGDHHQFAAACHFQRTVCRTIAFCHTAGRFAQAFHRTDINRHTFHPDIWHTFFKTGTQRTKYVHICHAFVMEIYHHIGFQCQRCYDIFQYILIIIFDQNFHGISPLSNHSTIVSSSNFTSGSLFLFLPLNTEPKFSLFTTPGAISISFVMAS